MTSCCRCGTSATACKAGGESATHTYTQPGTYTAKVTVTDPGSKSATATVQIVVQAEDDDERRGAVPPPDRGGVQGEEESATAGCGGQALRRAARAQARPALHGHAAR